ncbi:MAG TPA: DUF4175 domain-containing protein [Sphingomonas sp.]
MARDAQPSRGGTMTAYTPVTGWIGAARRQAARDVAMAAVPLVVAGVVLGWRIGGAGWAVALLIAGVVASLVIARMRARRFDRRWLVAALDAGRADVEDSSDLLFAEPHTLGPLQRLQRRRIEARLVAAPVPALHQSPRARWIALAWAAGLVVIAGALLWPRPREASLAPAREGLQVAPGIPRLVAQRLVVVPPAYTGLASRTLGQLDARVPAGSRLEWTLRFDPQPSGPTLAVLGERALGMARAGDRWTVSRVIDRSLLYRVVPGGGGPMPPLHRIVTVADQPPRIRLVEPAATLVPARTGQRRWSVTFVASDDYGIQPVGRLRLVVAQGEGENIRFAERMIAVRGTGDARARRFAATIDLAAIGFTEPGDLVAQLSVADTRTPGPQTATGPSVILRRTEAAPAASGLEGMTRRIMPAYFRSQRQIIIDAQALLAERPRPAADAFLSRSDALGEDQRLLRMRYGQFMGEESGGGATAALPTNDAEEGAEAPAAEVHSPGDGHDHGPAAEAPTFGSDAGVTATYGHVHDESEATTLLDPGTRATLRRALDAMWDSERALRQGDPRAALPHANRALRFIKEVQQATRIFLARTASRQPPIDLARRLTGDRSDLGRRQLAPAAADHADPVPAAIWRRLGEGRDPAAVETLSRWLGANEARVPDRLALAAAIDAVRRDPACDACRERLRGVLWSALPRPASGIDRRRGGDAVGRRYLEALR